MKPWQQRLAEAAGKEYIPTKKQHIFEEIRRCLPSIAEDILTEGRWLSSSQKVKSEKYNPRWLWENFAFFVFSDTMMFCIFDFNNQFQNMQKLTNEAEFYDYYMQNVRKL